MSKYVLKGICELECVDVSETELDMSIDDELCEAQDFSAQMEGVSKTGLLTLLGGERPKES